MSTFLAFDPDLKSYRTAPELANPQLRALASALQVTAPAQPATNVVFRNPAALLVAPGLARIPPMAAQGGHSFLVPARVIALSSVASRAGLGVAPTLQR